jgi:hypothetical protein
MSRVKAKRDARNPFASITPEIMTRYAGKVIAVNLESGTVVADADTVDGLRSKMQQDHRDVRYARLCLPNER